MNADKNQVHSYRCSSAFIGGQIEFPHVRNHIAPAALSAFSATSAPSGFDFRFSQRLSASAVNKN
jgi:hypothetical protein